MPITIVPTFPVPLVGPGLWTTFSSDAGGPFPTGTIWQLSVGDSAEGTGNDFARAQVDFSSNVLNFQWWSDPTTNFQGSGFATAQTGDQVHILAKINDRGNIVDSGELQVPWDATVGLGAQAHSLSQGSTSGGGLTPVQSQQLLEVHQSTLPSILVDTLTLVPLNSVPSAGPINAALPNPTFGVIVRIANVPPDLVPNTPDGDYWFPSLAVVRIFRGADLWKRVPIHTSSKLVELLDESIVAGLTAITATQWLLDLSVQVTFRQGVTGQVFTMLLP